MVNEDHLGTGLRAVDHHQKQPHISLAYIMRKTMLQYFAKKDITFFKLQINEKIDQDNLRWLHYWKYNNEIRQVSGVVVEFWSAVLKVLS